jgi:pyruvate/2-oxoglutarate dehydrogenase complex dihydrolipoamide acyltransferase (E2) component
MTTRQVRLPDLKAAGPVRLSIWLVAPGEMVFVGDRLVEVILGAATFDVAAPVSGRLIAQQAVANEVLIAGQALGLIEIADGPSAQTI